MSATTEKLYDSADLLQLWRDRPVQIIWMIVGVVFGAPLLILLGLVVANRLGKGGNTNKTITLLWLVLAVMLVLFRGFVIFGGAR